MEHILENTSLEKTLNLSLEPCMDSDTQANTGENYSSSGDKEVPFAAEDFGSNLTNRFIK